MYIHNILYISRLLPNLNSYWKNLANISFLWVFSPPQTALTFSMHPNKTGGRKDNRGYILKNKKTRKYILCVVLFNILKTTGLKSHGEAVGRQKRGLLFHTGGDKIWSEHLVDCETDHNNNYNSLTLMALTKIPIGQLRKAAWPGTSCDVNAINAFNTIDHQHLAIKKIPNPAWTSSWLYEEQNK